MADEKFSKEWEIISENLKRMKVPGGWIVHNNTHVVHIDRDISISESMIFLPDIDHTWVFRQK